MEKKKVEILLVDTVIVHMFFYLQMCPEIIKCVIIMYVKLGGTSCSMNIKGDLT